MQYGKILWEVSERSELETTVVLLNVVILEDGYSKLLVKSIKQHRKITVHPLMLLLMCVYTIILDLQKKFMFNLSYFCTA